MTLQMWLTGACVLITACGGAAVTEPAPAVAEATPPTTVVAAVEEPPALSNDQVAGLWCEYWIAPNQAETASPSRSADTQQYLFLDDGRFGWRAETAAGQEPTRREGQWRVVGSAIVLRDSAGQVLEQLAIADCPSNPEAEQLDAGYRCRSLGGKAFWRSKPANQVDASQYIR